MNRKEEAFAAAQRIINKVYAAGFDITNTESFLEHAWKIAGDINYNSGASRLVVWDDECDYVVKVARGEDLERYNKHEVEIYNAAVEEGLQHNFGWCACYIEPSQDEGYIPGIYVMEFLDGDEDDVCNDAYDYGYRSYCESNGLDMNSQEVAEDYDSIRYEDDDTLGELMNFLEAGMSTKEIASFETFLCKWDINDLHSGNMLYRGDRLVICDYAGWGW